MVTIWPDDVLSCFPFVSCPFCVLWVLSFSPCSCSTSFFLFPYSLFFSCLFLLFFLLFFFFLSPEKVDFLGHQQSRHDWTVGDRFWSELQLRVEGDLIGLGIVEDWTVYIFPGLSWHLPGSISFFSLQFVSSVSRGRRWQNRKCKTTSFWTEGYSSIFHFKYQRLFNLVPEI